MKIKYLNRKTQAGFTLLELLISLGLGVILLLGLLSIYIVAQQSDGQNRALNANSGIARQAFRILEYNFKLAGHVDPLDSSSRAFGRPGESCHLAAGERYGSLIVDVADPRIENIYRRYNDPSNTLPDSMLTAIGRVSCGRMLPVLGCGATEGFTNRPDIFSGSLSECSDESANDSTQAIEIAYQALATGPHGSSNLNNISSGSTAVDCTGTNVATANQNGFIVNQFFIEDDNGENALTCQSNLQDDNVALVQGVEEMTFRFITTIQEENNDVRIGETDSGRVLAAYKTAAELYQEANNAANLDWATVVGVEVCLVVSSPPRAGDGLSGLGKTQGENRPTCGRDDSGHYKNAIEKDPDKKDRYYQRFERIFKIPNALFISR